MSINDYSPEFRALEPDEQLRVLQEACKEILSADEYRRLEERAELLCKLREDDAAKGIIWPADTGGLQ